MLSTTERERGQILVLFVGGLITLMLLAALAFDAGLMLLERRDQQNAADAAAIAGARYLPGNTSEATNAARDIASANGFASGSSVSVDISIPPGPATSARFRNASSVEVTISATRPSVFAGIMGVLGWPVSARAVATNQDDVAAPFAMLALDPHECGALDVSGSGIIDARGDIQVNSDCDTGGSAAFVRTGNSSITVTATPANCNSVGGIKSVGGGDLICTRNEGAPLIPDPLADLAAPPVPGVAPDMTLITADDPDLLPPEGCPGAEEPATEAEPALCKIVPGGDYDTAVWRMYPGLYPGGIDLQAGTYYLEPGIYYIGGGGFQAGGNGVTLYSVAAGGTSRGGGILLYNGEIEGSAIDKVVLNGSDANIGLLPLDIGSRWDGLVIFQARIDIGGNSVDDVTINGGSSEMEVAGTIYVPDGQVRVNGSGGTIIVDQIIADQFQVTGKGGTIRVLYREPFLFKLIAAGLVE